MKGNSYYVAEQCKSYSKGTVYANVGDSVIVITCDHPNVWVVEDNKGERFTINPNKLSSEHVAPSAPEIKQRKKPESKKPLTQAEKIQLEYLNSLSK